jgi:prepilin-type processing-associated H-X9-DG protein
MNKVLWVLGDTHFHAPAFTDPRYLVDPGYASFAPYLRGPAIYKCPADQSTIASGGSMVPKIRSYAMNSYVGWSVATSELSPNYQIFTRMPQLARMGPAKVFLFQDVMPANLCYPAFMVYMAGVGRSDSFFHIPSSEHNRRGVVSFCDGHVEAHRWVDPRTRPPVPPNGIVAHSTPASNNKDLEWIRERTTVKQ